MTSRTCRHGLARAWWQRPCFGSLARLAVLAGVFALAFVTMFLMCQILGRTAGTYLVSLTGGIAAVAVSVTVAAGAVVGAHRWMSRCVPWWALLVPLAGLVAVPNAAVLAIGLNGIVGMPMHGCAWPGVDVEVCEGRNWSLFQDRLGYTRLAGSMDPETCRGFTTAVGDEPDSPLVDGWVRCPFDRPGVWERIACEDVALADEDVCFVCQGRSETADRYWYVQGFSEGCSRATVLYGVNVDPRDIDTCNESLSPRPCRAARLHRLP